MKAMAETRAEGAGRGKIAIISDMLSSATFRRAHALAGRYMAEAGAPAITTVPYEVRRAGANTDCSGLRFPDGRPDRKLPGC